MLPRCPFCQAEQPDDRLCGCCYSFGDRGLEIRAGTLFPGGLEVGEFVGSGGVASVYRAKSRRRPDDQLVVRFHHLGKKEHLEVFERFQRGVEVIRKLESLHLPKVFEVGRIAEPPLAYAVMEFVPHPNLRQFLDDNREAMSLRDKLELLRLLAVAMSAPHESGLVHRDIKPDNIMVESGEDGRARHVWLLDFDTVRIREHSELNETIKIAKGTQPGRRIGTPEYMAPEICDGRAKDAGPESDLYSLGIILFEMLTGRVPFDRSEHKTFEIYQLHIEKAILPLLGPLGAQLPGSVRQLLAKLTAKKQELRVNTAAKVVEMIDRCIEEIDVLGTGPKPPPPEPEPRPVPNPTPKPTPVSKVGTPIRGAGLFRSPVTYAALILGGIAVWAAWPAGIRLTEQDQKVFSEGVDKVSSEHPEQVKSGAKALQDLKKRLLGAKK